MKTTVPTARTTARRRLGGIALLVLLLGILSAPLADAWLHAQDDSRSALVHGSGGDCDLCRVAAAPLLEAGSTPEIARILASGATPSFHLSGDQTLAARAPSSEPPSRAPPA